MEVRAVGRVCQYLSKIWDNIYNIILILQQFYYITLEGTQSTQTSVKNNGQLYYDIQSCNCKHFICLNIVPAELPFFYTGCVLSLLNFTAIYWIYKMYGIVERRHLPRPNAVSHNIREKENKSVNPPCDLDLLQN